MLPNGVRCGEVAAGKGLIDGENGRHTGVGIARGKETAREQRNAQGAEVSGAEAARLRLDRVVLRRGGVAGDVEGGAGAKFGERKRVRRANGLNSRQGGDLLFGLLVKPMANGAFDVPAKIDAAGQHVARVKAERRVEQVVQTAEHGRGKGQQHEGEGDLRRAEQAAEPPTAARGDAPKADLARTAHRAENG